MQHKTTRSKKRISFLLSVLVAAASFSSLSSVHADGEDGIVLTNPTVTAVSSSTATCQFTSNKAGEYRAVVYLASRQIPVTPAEIITPADDVITSLFGVGDGIAGTVDYVAGDLNPLTSYKIYIMYTDPDTFENSNVVVCNVTTIAAPPTVTINPRNGYNNWQTDRSPKISFNEPVRNIDDTALTSSDLAELITFNKTDVEGNPVAFTATINDTKTQITVTPNTFLDNNQLYFLKMGATVEGSTGIPIAGFEVTFTTVEYNYYSHLVEGDGACWLWEIISGPNYPESSIVDLYILENCNLDSEYIVDDLYDGFGLASVNNQQFTWNVLNAFNADRRLIGDRLVILGEGAIEGSTYTITFADNNVTYEIVSVDGNDDLLISGDLGSDRSTRFITLGGQRFSYSQTPETLIPRYDPIILWEMTEGAELRFPDPDPNDQDQVQVFITGNKLQLKHYAYAYRNDGFTNSDEFFDSFLKFVNEDKNRTDVFSINYGKDKVAAKPSAPARQTYNLSFDQSFYGSDYLSDPKGEIRSILDEIKKKYGNLISFNE